MKKILIMLLFLFFGASYAFADLYQWQDKDGMLHITNDMGKVPDAYRDKVKVLKTTPPKPVTPAQTPETVSPALAPEEASTLYGDQTLEWWKEAFDRNKNEIQEVQSGIIAKRQYIDLFESGRRFGQMYGPVEVETYNKYKGELTEDEKRLAALNDDLTDLRRKAVIAGVPKSIRGE